ncbi:cell division control protein [Lichtheimia corymbifera JMRC:FSU:9682]|uniref:Cell division control protein n=1 Tax=Lichtheimia corymbifera JMRC:FSU:9682 TaxID=1263082 RepID=A0A068RYY3_9FUNG|nr:cell division control protein [Lichtheimia corymbifera JMRC:FSU:9682]
MAAAVIATSPHQSTGLRFANSFWDPSDRGVDVIIEKLHNSKQTCEEIKKLYEIRSQIEEDYGERLLKLSQLIVGQAEEGTLSESLSHIPSALETTARAHLDLAQQLKHQLEAPLDGFLREQRESRKQHHQQIENARQLKNMHYTNAIKAKEFYTAECTKVAGMEKYLRERGSEMTEDEMHQMKEEIDEGRKMMNAAEQEYRRAVDVFNSVTSDWVASWKGACDIFQDMEEKRIHYIHGSLRSFSTMMSSVYLVDDQCCERIRTTLELTDVRKDIEEFVTRYGTGNVMPDVMQFEPFSSMDIQSTPSSSIHHGPVLETKELPPMPESVNDNNDPAPTTEQQHVKDQSHDDSQGDAMTTAMAEVEEMLSIPESKPPAEMKSTHEEVAAAPKSTANEQPAPIADEQPNTESKSTSDQPAKEATVAMVTNDTAVKQFDSPAKETAVAMQPVINEDHAQSTSVSPEDPPIPATPPSPVNVDSKQREDNEEHVSAVEPAVAVATAAAAATTTGMELSTNNDAQQHNPALPDDKYKPMPNPEFQSGSSTSEQKRMSRVDSGNDMQASVLDPKPTDAVAATTLADASHQELKPTTRSLDATVAAAHETQPANDSTQGVHLSDPPSSSAPANDKNDDDASTENDYSLPPPKAEKWVISSIRRPQQLPVRVQNVRMSMNASSPSLTAPVVPEPDSRTPTASTSTGNKFHRPNAPLKIEIPNKPTSSPTNTRNNINTNPHQQHQQAPQAAAQQVIAAGRAHAHQTQSWQSPVNPSPSRRFSAMDGTRWQQQPPLEPLEQPLYEIEGEGQQHRSLADAPRPSESASHHKKGHLSSFVKGVLKSDQQDKRASALAAPLSSTADKKEKRFSMNIFGGKKDKRQQKQFNDDPPQQQQPVILEDEEVIHNSLGSRSTPVLSRPVSAVPVMRSMNNNYQSSPSPQRMMQQPAPSSSTGKAPAPVAAAAAAPRQDQLEDGSPIIEYVRAIWTYEAKIPSEMSFMAGDPLAVITKQIDGWWLAELMDPQRRQRGLIPGNYMEPIN